MDPDHRNIEDRYWGWTNDLIKKDLKENSFPFAALVENWIGDFNISSVLRNSNAFGAREFYYLGNKKYDRRGALGTYYYTNVTHLKTIEQLEEINSKYVFIGIDNISNSIPMNDFKWPKNSLMIFGEEGRGLTKEIQKKCKHIVHIKQYGSVRSINAACASSVAFYDYVKKYEQSQTLFGKLYNEIQRLINK